MIELDHHAKKGFRIDIEIGTGLVMATVIEINPVPEVIEPSDQTTKIARATSQEKSRKRRKRRKQKQLHKPLNP